MKRRDRNRTLPRLVYGLGRIPIVQTVLRRFARHYREGSVATVLCGRAAGLKWKRYHRYVSGYWLGIYEPDVQDAIARVLKKGHVFYDIGANAGFFSLMAARLVGPSGKVFAFEPLPQNAEVIAEQVLLNELANLEIIRAAVGRKTGEGVLIETGNSSMSHLAGNENRSPGLAVRVISLDEFIREHPPPDLVKVDVEGAEVEVLKGAQSLIHKEHPTFLVELHGEREAQDVFEILRQSGYALLGTDESPLQGDAAARHLMACAQS